MDKFWDSSMAALSASYQQTVVLLEGGKGADAAAEFHQTFMPGVKKFFTECETTYPTRYAKMTDWCPWVKEVYIESMKADKALAGGDQAEASKQLAAIRAQFDKLHQITDMRKVNDFAFAFRAAAARDRPSIDQLKALRQQMADAKLSAKAQADGPAFAKAQMEFLERIDGVLKDGAIDPQELVTLRGAADSFYRSYGLQFE